MAKIKKLGKKILCVLLSVLMVGTVNISAFASANSETTNMAEYRTYFEGLIQDETKGFYAGVLRQCNIYTYLKAGETVYFGSSVHDSYINEVGKNKKSDLKTSPTGCDIVVTNPDGTVNSFDVIQNDVGFIDDRTKIENGPQITNDDKSDNSKYIPLSFTASTSGVYEFRFQSRMGTVTAGTANVKVEDGAGALAGQGDCDVAFWDITVADQDGNEIHGRSFANYLAITTGAVPPKYFGEYYVVTKDGYIYDVTLEDLQPFGFVFFSNNQGLTTIGLTASSIYHSIYDDDNNILDIDTQEYVDFHHPNAVDTELAQTNMIFFEEPNKDLIGVLFDKPTEPQPITEINFYGHQENKTYYTQGGTFRFESYGSTSVSLVIDFNSSIDSALDNPSTDTKIINAINKYRDAGGTGIVEINGAVTDGWNEFEWNGFDNNNIHMPIGVYDAHKISITAHPKAGEIHFPLLDVEGAVHGMTIERLNGSGGRDSKLPSDSRFDIYYNNSPLAYGTIEGQADPTVSEKVITKIVSGKSNRYSELNDGTLSFKFNDNNLGGPSHFVTKDEYVVNYPNISTLIKNPNYVPVEQRTNTTDENLLAEPAFIHKPVDSRTTSFAFSRNKTNVNGGGGNQAAVDVWTYHECAVVSEVEFKAQIEIIEKENVGEISGFVFYDDYSNGTRGTYKDSDGDYPLSDIEVYLVDSKGNRLQAYNEKGYSLFKDITTGSFVFKTPDGIYVDENDNPVSIDPNNLDVVYYSAKTNAKGYYSFKGVYYGTSKDFYVKTNLTDVQKTAYTECTTNNDFNLAKKSPISQKVTLREGQEIAEFGKIGYTAPPTQRKDLTVLKAWDSEVENKAELVKVKLYQFDESTQSSYFVDEHYLSASNGWKYTYHDLNIAYKYYVEEYLDDPTGYDDDILIGRSEARYIKAEDFDSQITDSVVSPDTESDYSANFTFNPNIVGPTIKITNKEIEKDYKVVFHENLFGYSDENTNDIYRTYRRSNKVQDGEYPLSDSVDASHQYRYTIDAFYDIPYRENYVFAGWYYEPSFDSTSKVFKWTTDDFTGDNDDDNDGDKYTMTANNVYHIYAHWIPVGTVTKDANDEKVIMIRKDGEETPEQKTIFGGFELFGVQIRNYKYDPNYEYTEEGREEEQKEFYYGYKKEVHGLRYVTSIRNGLLTAVNAVFDNDAEHEYYDYEGTKTYITKAEENNAKSSDYVQNLDYGYVIGAESNFDTFYAYYNNRNGNGYAYDQIKYKATNVNGEKTTSKYSYISNVECTSQVDKYNIQTQILDHRNYDDYRIMSMVITYNELTDSANMVKNSIVRPYLKYIDSNGLVRVFYTNYNGGAAKGKGCLTSYNYVSERIKDELHNVINPTVSQNEPMSKIGGIE